MPLKDAELTHLTWHRLSHNAGSYWLSKDVQITVVSETLGHTSPAITMAIYAHELREEKQQIAEVWEALG